MYTAKDFRTYLGKTVEFKTPWGVHHGKVKDINSHSVLMEMPYEYAHTNFHDALGLDAVHTGFFGGAGGCVPHHRPFLGTCCWIPFVFIIFIVICPFFWCW